MIDYLLHVWPTQQISISTITLFMDKFTLFMDSRAHFTV